MKPGGGKSKGAQFERSVCKALSLWISHGKREDCLWRSAMSGGRATVHGRKGVNLADQAGDITATSSVGHLLTDRFYIECKHHANMGVDRFILGTAKLAKFWDETCDQATTYGRNPMLIARPNAFPTLVLVSVGALRMLCDAKITAQVYPAGLRGADVFFFDDIVATRFNPMMRERVRLK